MTGVTEWNYSTNDHVITWVIATVGAVHLRSHRYILTILLSNGFALCRSNRITESFNGLCCVYVTFMRDHENKQKNKQLKVCETVPTMLLKRLYWSPVTEGKYIPTSRVKKLVMSART